jgi:polyphenol oxidase
MDWRERNGVRWLEAELDGARAAFTARCGGVSGAPFDSLNLGMLTDDIPGNVRDNRQRLAAALGHEANQIVFARQVHGGELIAHDGAQRCAFLPDGGDSSQRDEDPPEADGHVVSQPGLVPLVFAADCLPVALSGPDGVAMLHCGWRGLAAGIVAAGAKAVGATDAAIGPGVGPCCYEVGDEVRKAFSALGGGVVEDRMLDLPEVARRLLREAGVERIDSAELCTSCNPELFFSHRRDAGRTGRQAGLVWIEAP